MDAHLVMLIDSDYDMQRIFMMLMESRGIEVLIEADPHKAVHVAAKQQPAVIVTELFRRTDVGWATLEKLKAHPATRAIPLVVLTTHTFADDQNAACASGADVFLMKPVDIGELWRAIEHQLPTASTDTTFHYIVKRGTRG